MLVFQINKSCGSWILLLGGVYMSKLAPARVSYRDDFLISYRIYMITGSFLISLFECTLHVVKIHLWFKIANITHELLVPVYRQTDFPPEKVDVSRLQISYRSEILAPVRQQGLTHAGATCAGMTFCDGIMWTNVEPWEGTGVNQPQRESRPGVM